MKLLKAPFPHHSRAGTTRPAAPPARFALIVYDIKQACEAKTAPHRRTPPLQLTRLKRAVGATIEARAKAAGLDRIVLLPGDMYVLFDGGKEGNHSKMKGAFVDPEGTALKPKVTRTLQLVFSEESVAERRGYSRRGAASLRHGERCLLVTHSKPNMPTRKRKHFTGTNRGDAVVGVPALSVEAMWRLPFAQKRDLLDKYRVEVGGPTASDGEDDDDDDDAIEELAVKARMDDSHFMYAQCHDLVNN